MVDPLSYFSFQPVLHIWCNKSCGICYLACGMMDVKELSLLIGKTGPDGAVAMSLANRMVGTGFVSRYRLQPRAGF